MNTASQKQTLFFAAILSLSFLSVPAYASDEDVDPLFSLTLEQLLKIRVKGISKKDESLRETPMSVYVFSKEEIDKFGIRYFSELLGRSPGFAHYDIEYTGLNGPIGRGQQSIWRFGFSLELAPIPDWSDIYLPMDFFQQVEVARGPAGLTWGSAAEAGLFNLEVRDDLHGSEARVEYGDSGRQQFTYMYGDTFHTDDGKENSVFVGLSTGEQDFEEQENAWDIPGEKWYTNGWNSSYALLGKIKYKEIKVLFLKTKGDKVTPTYRAFEGVELRDSLFDAQGEELHDTMEIDVFRTEYHPTLSIASLAGFETYFYVNHYTKTWAVEGFAVDTQKKDSFGFSSSSHFANKQVEFTTGGDLWQREEVDAASMTHPDFNTPAFSNINWWAGTHASKKFTSRNLYAQSKLKFHRDFIYILGGRIDWYDDLSDNSDFTPRLGVIYLPNEELTFKFIWNEAHRQPTAGELYGRTPGAETLQALDFITQFNYPKRVSGDITFFYQEMKDQITFDSINDVYSNVDGSSTAGVEWSLKSTFSNTIQFYGNGSYLFKHEIDTNQAIANDDFFSIEPVNSDGDFLFVPKWESTIGIKVKAYQNDDYVVHVNFDNRTLLDIPYFIDSENNERKKDAYFFDIGAQLKFKNQGLKASLYAKNVFDVDSRLPAYGEHTIAVGSGTLEPEGRRVWFKLELNW